MVLQILRCSKFRKHQIELEIKKTYRNTKIHKKKNIVEKNANMENAKRINFFPTLYTLSMAQINFKLQTSELRMNSVD